MKIHELMSLKLFKKCKLLTGDIGIENEISSAMVLEAIDIENWSRKNQLILTSFYAFKDANEEEWVNFFEKTKKIGISGLVIKMDRLITRIPESLISLCFQYEIPLIKVTIDIAYEKIMLAIYEPILDAQGHLLKTYYNVRQRFTELERNLVSLEQILDVIYELTEVPCSLQITGLDAAIHRGNSFKNYLVTKREPVEKNEFTKNRYERLTLLSPDQTQQLIGYKTIFLTRNNDYCTLMICQQSTELQDSNIIILENAIDVIHEYLRVQYQLKKDRYMRLNNLADAILQNTPSNMDELNSLLDDADMNLFPYYQGVAIANKSGVRTSADKNSSKRISKLRKNTLFFDHYNYTIILYNLVNQEDALTKTEIQQLFCINNPLPTELTVSISQVKKKHELKQILFECLDSLRFNNEFYTGSIISFHDLGIFQYFITEDNLKKLESIIPEELINLQLKHYDFFETLLTFFQCGRNYKKTAETLFLHSKTIRYRMSRIEQMLNIDLTNPVQLVNYEIATYLLKTKRRELDA